MYAERTENLAFCLTDKGHFSLSLFSDEGLFNWKIFDKCLFACLALLHKYAAVLNLKTYDPENSYDYTEHCLNKILIMQFIIPKFG